MPGGRRRPAFPEGTGRGLRVSQAGLKLHKVPVGPRG